MFKTELNMYLKGLRNGMLFVLAWVAWVSCLRRLSISVVGVDGVLAGCRACVGDVLAWVAC